MPLSTPTQPALPAIDIELTFSPGSDQAGDQAPEPMSFWLNGSQIPVPEHVAKQCRQLPFWEVMPPDYKLRVVLSLSFKAPRLWA